MKVLAVSDEVLERLYNVGVRDTYPDIRMLLGCGDLPYEYLEFLVTVYNVPMFYVPGNHDPQYGQHSNTRAEGGTNLDGEVVWANGLLMAGLGGCNKYGRGPNQYTQREMFTRVYQLLPKILLQTTLRRRKLDLLLTHSPPEGIHDEPDDPPHRGFRALNYLLEAVKPRMMMHGHTMFYKNNITDHITLYRETKVINVYPFRVMNIDL